MVQAGIMDQRSHSKAKRQFRKDDKALTLHPSVNALRAEQAENAIGDAEQCCPVTRNVVRQTCTSTKMPLRSLSD